MNKYRPKAVGEQCVCVRPFEGCFNALNIQKLFQEKRCDKNSILLFKLGENQRTDEEFCDIHCQQTIVGSFHLYFYYKKKYFHSICTSTFCFGVISYRANVLYFCFLFSFLHPFQFLDRKFVSNFCVYNFTYLFEINKRK